MLFDSALSIYKFYAQLTLPFIGLFLTMAVEQKMHRRNSGIPLMQVFGKVGSIPIVDCGISTANKVYKRVKGSNRLFTKGFDAAETVTNVVRNTVMPVAWMFEGPLRIVDNVLCRGVDFAERHVPAFLLCPPEVIYWDTRKYMSNRLVKPVLTRANSVKNLGHVVLDSRVSNYAADRLDGALNACDRYMDQYLPAEPEPVDQPDGHNPGQPQPAAEGSHEAHVIQTIHRGQQISRKLKRRLTFRTRQELTALKKQSIETVHVVFYAAELIATNPRLAVQRAIELWQYLSADEPENQARPKTLEQLLVLLTRESARKVVHLTNFTAGMAMRVPRYLRSQTRELIHYMLFTIDSLIKVAHLEKAKNATITEATGLAHRLQHSYDDLQNQTTMALERLAVFLSGRLEAEKITTSANPRRRIQNRANNNPMHSSINGVY